jgi:hypothetical protein
MSIAGGFTKLALNKNKELANKRKIICDKCPVSNYGASKFCKSSLGGCGCLLSPKRRDEEETCPLGKW